MQYSATHVFHISRSLSSYAFKDKERSKANKEFLREKTQRV